MRLACVNREGRCFWKKGLKVARWGGWLALGEAGGCRQLCREAKGRAWVAGSSSSRGNEALGWQPYDDGAKRVPRQSANRAGKVQGSQVPAKVIVLQAEAGHWLRAGKQGAGGSPWAGRARTGGWGGGSQDMLCMKVKVL